MYLAVLVFNEGSYALLPIIERLGGGGGGQSQVHTVLGYWVSLISLVYTGRLLVRLMQ